ncbi:MAG: calcium-translocating P-type ATPase, PMCA-type [Clostridia bacterium]|nr:calcium-translocating P-type ATPase, PMCA-type [Clostridia bacterium]
MMKSRESTAGLTDAEAELSRRENGENVLERGRRRSFLRAFVSNLGDPVTRILLVALVVNLIFSAGNSPVETVGIALAVLVATLISTVSEHSSQAAFDRLESDSGGETCRVRRGGELRELPVSELVVGDVILLSAGEKIPADAYLLTGGLTVDQSAMTGESGEVKKSPRGEEKCDPCCEKALFRGCPVLSGQGEARVFAVGGKTFLGAISREITEETRESPLRRRLSRLARQISRIGYILALLVALAYLFNNIVIDSGFDRAVILLRLTDRAYMLSTLLSALTLGLTVIVMAVPEGLPMMIAVVLASNLRRMMRDNVLVRKPVGIEAAGSMNILFTDKTGTLTEGNHSLGAIILGDGYVVEDIKSQKISSELRRLFALSCRYNVESVLQGGRIIGGNGADRALAAAGQGMDTGRELRVRDRTPFDSERKYSSVTLEDGTTLIKGAPERILPSVTGYLSSDGMTHVSDKRKIAESLRAVSKNGTRVLALAYSRSGDGGLTLICFVTLLDKIRKEAAPSVAELTAAGVQVVMITGDSRETAESIAEGCGIISGDRRVCLTSDELSRLSDSALRELLPRLAVVARALPTDKSRLVRVAQDANLVVGMTGDGVNDAPALRRADVGFAMGSGTGVAREAGDIVILDNNLSSVVRAVLYGRTVFKSIRKFITLQLTMNLCACGISMIGPFLGFDSPVTVVQMLWINMIMDTLGGLAFAGEPPLPEYMRERPKRRDEPILNGYMVHSIVLHGGFTLALCVAFLRLPSIVAAFRAGEGSICLLTGFFAFFIFSGVLNCFGARTDRLNLFAGLGKNRGFLLIMASVCAIQLGFVYLGGSLLRTVPLTPEELCLTLAISLSVIPAEFLRKLLWRVTRGKRGY